MKRNAEEKGGNERGSELGRKEEAREAKGLTREREGMLGIKERTHGGTARTEDVTLKTEKERCAEKKGKEVKDEIAGEQRTLGNKT